MKFFYDFGGSDNIPLFNEITKCWRKLKLQNEKRDVAATSLGIKVKKKLINFRLQYDATKEIIISNV
jgi:hypothetical protein